MDTSEPKSSFQDLYQFDFVHAVGHVLRRELDQIKSGLYQKAMLLQGLSKNKDLDDPCDPALVAGMEYSVAIGVTILDIMADMNDNFQNGFKNTDTAIVELGLKTDAIN